MIEVKYEKPAEKFLAKNKEMNKRFRSKFHQLACEIEMNNNSIVDLETNLNMIKMEGDISKGRNRLRIGDYRALFTYFNNELLIRVFEISSRGNIYNK